VVSPGDPDVVDQGMQEGLRLGPVAGLQDVPDVVTEDAEVGGGGCGRRLGEQVLPQIVAGLVPLWAASTARRREATGQEQTQ
jgi:hypothetical protein